MMKMEVEWFGDLVGEQSIYREFWYSQRYFVGVRKLSRFDYVFLYVSIVTCQCVCFDG